MTKKNANTTLPLFLTEADVHAMPPFEWLIPGVLPMTGIALLYAKPGEGKSFIAIALAEAIAHGAEGWGQKFEPGQVVYVAAEGVAGISKRLEGWRKHHGISKPTKNLLLYRQAVNFRDQKEVEQFIQRLCHQLDGLELPLRLLIIDTLSRCFGGGDENSQAAMSAFIGHLQKDIVDRFGCLVMVLHHTSRGNESSPRGSNVNDGAADTMLHVSKEDDGQLITVVKQKEGKDGVGLFFERHVVEVLAGDATEETLVMEFSGSRNGRDKRPAEKTLGGKQALALKVLTDAGCALSEGDWWQHFKAIPNAVGVRGRRTFTEAKGSLQEQGLVYFHPEEGRFYAL